MFQAMKDVNQMLGSRIPGCIFRTPPSMLYVSLTDPDGGNVPDLQEATEGSWHRCILVDSREQVPEQSPRCMPPVAEQD